MSSLSFLSSFLNTKLKPSLFKLIHIFNLVIVAGVSFKVVLILLSSMLFSSKKAVAASDKPAEVPASEAVTQTSASTDAGSSRKLVSLEGDLKV